MTSSKLALVLLALAAGCGGVPEEEEPLLEERAEPRAPCAAGARLKVLTLNMRGHAAGPAELQRIAELLAAEDPDLVGLQEVYWYLHPSASQAHALAGLLLARTRRVYHVALQTQHSYGVAGIGVALLGKPTLGALQAHALPKLEKEGRVVLRASLGTSPPVDAFVTHLTNDAAKAAVQAKDLVGWLAGFPARPRILVGDFNAGPSSTAHVTLASSLVDAWAATRGPSGGATIPAHKPGLRIDYIFVGGGALPRSAATRGSAALSDHLAVTAEVEIAR